MLTAKEISEAKFQEEIAKKFGPQGPIVNKDDPFINQLLEMLNPTIENKEEVLQALMEAIWDTGYESGWSSRQEQEYW